MGKGFTTKHQFSLSLVWLSFIFVVAGWLGSTILVVADLHQNQPLIVTLVWFLIFLGGLRLITGAWSKHRIFRFFGSIRFSVILLSFAVLLVFVGTLAQKHVTIVDAVDYYFHSLFVAIPYSVFTLTKATGALGELKFILPGGFLLAGFLLVNLVIAQVQAYRLTSSPKQRTVGILILVIGLFLLGAAIWFGLVNDDIPSAYLASYKRVLFRLVISFGVSFVLLIGSVFLFKRKAGLVILHFGIVLLIVSEFITAFYSQEGRMVIHENERQYTVDQRGQYELVFQDLSVPNSLDKSVVVSDDEFSTDEWTNLPTLPFELQVVQYFEDGVLGRRTKNPHPAAEGILRSMEIKTKEFHKSEMKTPIMQIVLRSPEGEEFYSAIVKFKNYLKGIPVRFFYGGKYYDLFLRYQKSYLFSRGAMKPFCLELLDFRSDKYMGTENVRSYSSLVRLIDPDKGVNRQVLISMNTPLRYAGRTFYQSSFTPGESGTVLSVVKNPGWTIPYLSGMLLSIGLLFHFCFLLSKFIKRRF